MTATIGDRWRKKHLWLPTPGRLPKFAAACLLGLSVCLGQVVPGNGVGEKESSAANSAPRAVVQLLAIGPAAQGRNRECSATGFLVNEDGYILTNAHVVHDAQRCLAASPKSKILAKVGDGEADAARAVSCDIVGLDEVHDLAILKAERPLATLGDASAGSFALLNAKKVAEGASVLVTGHPVFAWQPETQAGKVIRHTLVGPLAGSASPASGEATQALVINVTLREGHSGSPVYLPNEGGVIGIVIGRQAVEPSHSLAVSAHHIIEFLDDLGVKWHAKR